VLAQIPIDQRLRAGGDDGHPLSGTDDHGPAAVALRGLAATLTGRGRGLAGMQLGLSPAGSR
jgi:ATP-binding protein involved in chromosome partitioning